VLGYPPGGNNDFLGRLLAMHMGDDLGQKVMIEYRPGAASNIGAAAVARTAPDGYTLYLGGRPNTTHKVLYPGLKYDFSRDLTPIGLVATTTYVMVINNAAPSANVRDLVALAQAYSGGLTCASGGTGTTDHLLCELFQREAKIKMVHVPYRGSAGAFADLMGGRIDMYITPLAAASPHIAAGKLRAIAVMARSRVPALRDVPAIAESGFPRLALGAWYGLMVPAGTPPHIVARLNRAINSALTDPVWKDAMTQREYGVPPPPNTQQMLMQLIAEETDRWTAILSERNIRPLQ
jgi:tripartite-type tricarboxylate transporter receptor subunit TctC